MKLGVAIVGFFCRVLPGLWLSWCGGGWLQGQEVLQTVAAVRALPLERAGEALPVEVEGVIGFIEYPGTVFIQDEGGASFFRAQRSIQGLRVGDRVKVWGETHTGLYLTGIKASRFERMQSGAAPLAAVVTYDDLLSGRFHYQRVAVQGVVRRVRTRDEELRLSLTLALGRQLLEVRVDELMDEVEEDWVDRVVRVEGLAAGGINDRRQLVLPYLRVMSWGDVTVLAAARSVDQLPVTSVGQLLRFPVGGAASSDLRRVKMRGVVLGQVGGARLFLREHGGETEAAAAAFGVHLAEGGERFEAGELLEVTGFPVMSGFSGRLSDAQVIGRQPGQMEDAVGISLALLNQSEWDGEWVRVQGFLMDEVQGAEGREWRLQAGDSSLRVLWGELPAPEVERGARVEVSGIFEVISSEERGFRSLPTGGRLLMCGADWRLLGRPAWWTAGRLAGLAGMLLLVVLGAVVWIGLLRRQVAKQAERLAQRVAVSAALEERQRIAREFHDSLEQELAGLAIRLGAVASLSLEPQVAGLVKDSLSGVNRVQVETRDLLSRLRAEDSGVVDLKHELQLLAERQRAMGMEVVLEMPDGEVRGLVSAAAHHLRMMAQEAMTNAVKHAKTQKLRVSLVVADGILQLVVEDEGLGFDPRRTESRDGHFGLMGMKERARKMGAILELRSAPGRGTRVEVKLPLV